VLQMARIHPSMALRPAVNSQDRINLWPRILFQRRGTLSVAEGWSFRGVPIDDSCSPHERLSNATQRMGAPQLGLGGVISAYVD